MLLPKLGHYPADDVTLADLTAKVNHKAGQGKAYKLKFAVPADLPAGDYTLIAVVEPGAGIFDADASNNAARAAVRVE